MTGRAGAAALAGFAELARQGGLAVATDRTEAFAAAVHELDPLRADHVYWAGRLTFCASRDDISRYDAVFSAWLAGRPRPIPIRLPALTEVRAATPAAALENRDTDQPAGTTSMPEGASDIELLRHRDLAGLTEPEREQARTLLALLRPVTPRRRSRRYRPAHRGPIDAHRTVRTILREGGEPNRLLRRRHRDRPRRIVLLLDVSGSMQAYADTLLRFAYATVSTHPRTVEAYTMGTRLTRVTRELRQRDVSLALIAAAGSIPDWSGGTRLGEQLGVFLQRWRDRARGAIVVVASDGWERGGSELLGLQMARLHRLAHRVIWVNPHKAHDGYRPATAGMVAALPHVDDFVAGHSLAAYQRLADLLGAERVGGAAGA
ncbi:MAG: VWA domain-containing protein [Sporichthyaceae bacterium]|nr:VWA domain-containing protein [Sporichthyaceae bacterium]